MYISVAKENSDNSVWFYDQEVKFDELSNYTSKWHYSHISFKGGYRKGENFQGLSIVPLDIDNGYSIKELIEKLGDTKALIVTTKSHQLAFKNGKPITPRDRYRLFFPLEEPITDAHTYKIVVSALIKEFKADEACKDLARFFYCNPNQEVYYVN